MMEENNNDLIGDGIGNFPGGTYRNVTVNGVGSIQGDVKCIDFKCSGLARINGNLKAESVTTDGMGRVNGDVECDKLCVGGKLDISKDLRADYVELNGMVKVDGNLDAENFVSCGSFSIGGLLNAETIDIGMQWMCQAKEIGGKDINVHMDRAKAKIGILGKPVRLTSDCIEGDNICLEYTYAKVVRGNNIKIGPGCRIELAEYTGKFEKADNAEVKESKKNLL